MFSIRKNIFAIILLLFSTLSAQQQFTILKQMLDSVSITRMQTHIDQLQQAGGHWSRVTFTPGNDSAVQYVYNEFKKIPGLSTIYLDTFYIPTAQSPYNSKPVFNVVATLQGKKYPNNAVVLGAHIDCSGSRMGDSVWNKQWSTMHVPGADDNASGVAGVIELARLLSDTSFHYNNENTIAFVAFGVEEAGVVYPYYTLGSIHFAASAKAQGMNIIGMASLDMIGFNDLNNMYLNIASDEQSQWLGKHVVAMNTSFGLGITLNAPPFTFGRWSDHASFWDQQYSAVCIIECTPPWTGNPYYNANPYYHTSSDTLGTLNGNLLQKAAQLALASFGTLGATATHIRDEKKIITPEFVLEQNYPNPFNPVTTIRFTLHVSRSVSLKVYDILGNEITTLVHSSIASGVHTVQFHAGTLSSGVYMYRLETGGQVLTKRMVLMK